VDHPSTSAGTGRSSKKSIAGEPHRVLRGADTGEQLASSSRGQTSVLGQSLAPSLSNITDSNNVLCEVFRPTYASVLGHDNISPSPQTVNTSVFNGGVMHSEESYCRLVLISRIVIH
jgi:hypothetical protein